MEFEQRRSVRRSQRQLQLSPHSRSQLLLEWGVSNHEIILSVRAAVKAKRQRRRTVASLGTYDVIEEMIENTSSTIIQALKVGKGRRQTTTDQVNSETERQVQYCSKREINGGALFTLDKLANDYPDVVTAATSSPTYNDCTTVSELELNGSPGSQNFIASIDVPRKVSEIQYDRAPIKPRRELSPIRTDFTKRRLDMTIDCISAALDKSCSLFMNDPDFDLPQLDSPLEISAYQDFDSSITSRETRDDRILHFSFAQHPYNDGNTSTAMMQKAPLFPVDNLSMGDGETTINTDFVQAMVRTDTVTSPSEMHSVFPTDDTNNGTNGNGLKTEPVVTEMDRNDDDSSIDSHLINLLLGFDDTLPHPEQSGSTWPETSRRIVSSDISELFINSTPKIRQSIDLKDTALMATCAITSSVNTTGSDRCRNQSGNDSERYCESKTTATTSTMTTNDIVDTRWHMNGSHDDDAGHDIQSNQKSTAGPTEVRTDRTPSPPKKDRHWVRSPGEMTELIEL